MTYYNVCPYCGNNLDPGEKCDCREHEEELSEYEEEIKQDRRTVRINHELWNLYNMEKEHSVKDQSAQTNIHIVNYFVL